MSKTLEELGYEKLKGFTNDVYTTKSRDKWIHFKRDIRKILCDELISMEELKIIYKWCEEHNWIEAEPVLIETEEDREYIDYCCPNCHVTLQQKKKGAKRITIFRYKHCYMCGQKLNWDAVEQAI